MKGGDFMAAINTKFFKVFPIAGRRPEEMTAGELWHHIKECSRKNYGWVTSTAKIIKMCREPGFPCGVREKIERYFLKCFASDWRGLPSYRGIEDDQALIQCYLDCKDEKLRRKFLCTLAEKRLELGLREGVLNEAFWTDDRHKHFRREWCRDAAESLDSRITEEDFDLIGWGKSLIPKFKLDYAGMYDLGYFDDGSGVAEEVYNLIMRSGWQIAS